MFLNINHISFPGLGIEDIEINSQAFSLFGGKIKVAWYGIIIMCGIIFAFFYVYRRFKENKMSTDDLVDLALFTVVSGIVGARIYFILFKLDNYIVNTGHFFSDLGETLKRMFSVWNGGLAIYGAVIAGGIAAGLVARHKKMNVLQITDFLAPGVMMAQAIGRWGNFCNAEAHGSVTDLPWRMGILQGGEWNYYHPTFLYESLWNFIGFFIIHFVFVKHKKFNGEILFLYMMWYGLGRMFVEGLRTDSLYLGSIRISQLVGFLSLIIGLILFVVFYNKSISEGQTNGDAN